MLPGVGVSAHEATDAVSKPVARTTKTNPEETVPTLKGGLFTNNASFTAKCRMVRACRKMKTDSRSNRHIYISRQQRAPRAQLPQRHSATTHIL